MNSRNKYAVVEGLLCSCGLRTPGSGRSNLTHPNYDRNRSGSGKKTIPMYPPKAGGAKSLTVPMCPAGLPQITTLKKQEGVE